MPLPLLAAAAKVATGLAAKAGTAAAAKTAAGGMKAAGAIKNVGQAVAARNMAKGRPAGQPAQQLANSGVGQVLANPAVTQGLRSISGSAEAARYQTPQNDEQWNSLLAKLRFGGK